jgi:flagellar hook-basal body complex protein FliE
MSIDAIGAVGASSGLSAAGGLSALNGLSSLGTTSAASTSSAAATSGASGVFGTTLTGAIDNLQAMQSSADTLAVKAVTGDLDDIHDYTIAASQASVTLELTAALRNKAVEAFSEIMRLQA